MTYERIMGLQVTDDKAYSEYRKGMLPILESYGGCFGYDFVVSEVLKSKGNDPINRVFTIDFPSEDAMKSFFSDPSYLDVKKEFFERSVGAVTVISLHEKQT